MLVVNNKKFLKKVRFIFDKGTNRFLMNLKNKILFLGYFRFGFFNDRISGKLLKTSN